MGEYGLSARAVRAAGDAVEAVGERHARYRPAARLDGIGQALPGSASGAAAGATQERWAALLDAVVDACTHHARAAAESATGFERTDAAAAASLRSAGNPRSGPTR